MKVSSSHAQIFDQFPGKGHMARNKAADRPAMANMGETAAAPQTKANLAANAVLKEIPPGLERVQARLQAAPVEDLSKGQINAMAKINRNIARYLEVQAMATPAPEQAASATPATSPAAEVAEIHAATPTTPEISESGNAVVGTETVVSEPAADAESA